MGFRQKIRNRFGAWFGPIPNPEKWVFIVGCYNSGTTLVHELLSQHPSVGSMPDEGQFFTDQFLLPKEIGLARLWALRPELFYLDENAECSINIERLKRQWGARYNDLSRPILVEKSPTNAARTRWLQRYFENAHFIGIVRNGYAVAEGIRRKAKHSVRDAAIQWGRSNEIMVRDFPMLDQKMLVRYEDLAAAPAKVWGDILAFLRLPNFDLPFDDQLWDIHEQTASIHNMNQRSMDALSDEDYQVIEQVAGNTLSYFGYLR